jgi:hypothetical protein
MNGGSALWTVGGGLAMMPVNRQLKRRGGQLLHYVLDDMHPEAPVAVAADASFRELPADCADLNEIMRFYGEWRAVFAADNKLSLYLRTHRGFFCLEMLSGKLMQAMPPNAPCLDTDLAALYASPVQTPNSDETARFLRFKQNCLLNMLLQDCYAVAKRQGKLPATIKQLIGLLHHPKNFTQESLTTWKNLNRADLTALSDFLGDGSDGLRLFYQPDKPTSSEMVKTTAQLGMVFFSSGDEKLQLFLKGVEASEGTRSGWLCRHRLRYHICVT